MSIFSSIADAIAGSRADAAMLQQPPLGVDVPADGPRAEPPTFAAAHLAGAGYQPIPRQQVEESLANLAEQRGGAFNWKESIVDLMKLLKLDSSLQALQQLGQELGYQGARDGSPEMTDWLHREVMSRLTGEPAT